MKIEAFTHYKEMDGEAYVVDYTEATRSAQKVHITETPPPDIGYFHLTNPRRVNYWAINLEENPAVLKGFNQCECMFASSKSTHKGWVCLVELKYCKERNIEKNSEGAFKQLHETLKRLVELNILDYQSHRIYLNISIPEHSHREPFTAFQNLQDEQLERLQKHKVKLLGYNKALILNESYIKIPKEVL